MHIPWLGRAVSATSGVVAPRFVAPRGRRQTLRHHLLLGCVAALTAAIIVVGALAGATPTAHAASYVSSTNWPILFIHGFSGSNPNGSSNGVDCGATWGTAKTYLSNSHSINGQSVHWTGQLITIGYYTGDTNCNVMLGNYASHCTNYNAGNQGTNNETLYHLACELDWYIWLTWSQYGKSVQIVTHSMGGLIARYGIYQWTRHYNSNFTGIGSMYVQDVVTLDTPHGGVPVVSLFACGNCTQFDEMQSPDAFMQEMYNGTTTNGVFHPGQNPQGSGWGTDWTLMGSFGTSFGVPCDLLEYQYHTATYMSGGHKSGFYTPCYDHGGFLTDTSDAGDATIDWCDGCATAPSSWIRWTQAPHALKHMLLALMYSNW